MSENVNARWELAQSHEKALWNSVTEKYLLEHSKHYAKKAEIILEEAQRNFKDLSKLKILQVGCGPMDVINEIRVGEKHSIDPLADFYKKKFNFNYKDTHFVNGMGENLPYKDDFFDVIIFANVLDHTSNPGKVLSEIKRVLKPNGIVRIEAHFYQEGFIRLAKVFGFFKKRLTGKVFNPCHPHMFRRKELNEMIREYFKIYSEKTGEDIEKGLRNLNDIRKFMKGEKLTRKLPAFFGLLGIINYTTLCRKN
ncbi:MAG: class I SAM-dependent methyltransferase [Nanoarchaeota archaeon]